MQKEEWLVMIPRIRGYKLSCEMYSFTSGKEAEKFVEEYCQIDRAHIVQVVNKED